MVSTMGKSRTFIVRTNTELVKIVVDYDHSSRRATGTATHNQTGAERRVENSEAVSMLDTFKAGWSSSLQ